MYKKHLFLAGLILLLSLHVSARFTAGLRGGINANHFYHSVTGNIGPLNKHTGSNTGFHAGMYANLPLFRNASLSPELLFSQRGMSRTIIHANGDLIKPTLILNYIEIPVLFSYRIFKGLHADIGPDAGILISTAERRKSASVLNPQYNSLDLGMNAGVRYYVFKKLFFTARYRAGLLAVNETNLTDQQDAPAGKASSYNRGWMMGMGFALR